LSAGAEIAVDAQAQLALRVADPAADKDAAQSQQ